jgi:hypothetical protein
LASACHGLLLLAVAGLSLLYLASVLGSDVDSRWTHVRVIAGEIRRICWGRSRVGNEQPGDGLRGSGSADKGAFRRSRASRDPGPDGPLLPSVRGSSPAGDDHAPDDSQAARATADPSLSIGCRLWKQLTGSQLRKGLAALSTAALTAAVATIVTAFVSGWFSSGASNSATGGTQPVSAPSIPVGQPVSGPPIRASSLGCPTAPPYSPLLASVYHETSSDHPGLATVFPGKLNLSKADLQHLNKEGSVAWLAGRDGYDGSDTHLKLTLTGCQPVRILSMRAVILSRSRPLHGTIFQPASQGGVFSLTLRFNLDSGSPVATQSDNNGGSFNYFERYTFTLAPHEQHTFEIIGTTLRSSVTWKLDVEFLVHNKTVNETIEDGSQPFRTTALLKNADSLPNPYPHYRAAYAQCYGYGGQPFPAVCSHLAPGTSWVKAK